jgi:hypothetical protein
MHPFQRLGCAAAALAGLALGGCGSASDGGAPPVEQSDTEALGEAQQAAGATPVHCTSFRRGNGGKAYDTSIYHNKPGTNYGSATTVIVSGGAGTLPPSPRYALLRFDLGAIPAGATVISASLNLDQTSVGPEVGGAYRITKPWDEATVTWSSFGNAFDPAVVKNFNTSIAKLKIDVLPLAKLWVSNPSSNHGLLLKTGGDGKMLLKTQEWPLVAQRPFLSACYKVVCDAGHADCNASAPDGCETDLGTTANCGACGKVCSFPHASASCEAAACVLGACDAGFADCDGDPANGCETPTTTVSNCGGCGVVCADAGACSTPLCLKGTCARMPVPDGASCDDGASCTSGDQCSAGSCAGSPIPPTTATVVTDQDCYDLESGAVVAGDAFGGCSGSLLGDLHWTYVGGWPPHARLAWNDVMADAAFLALPFDAVTFANVAGRPFCDTPDSPDIGCVVSDPHSALGPARSAIVRTATGRHFKIDFLSESDTDGTVTFRYSELTALCSPGDGGDADGDGHTVGQGDCDDAQAAVHPGAAEVADELDNDCNGKVDDGIPLGACASGPGEGPVLFCDDFDDGTIYHTTNARNLTIDGTPDHWQAIDGDWASSAFVHGCELQYYTLYDANYSVSGPQNYAAPGHQSNFTFDAGNTSISLVLRHEPGTEGYIPPWMTEPTGCWMDWSFDNTAPVPSNNHRQTFDHTSGWLDTPTRFKYGKFEISARLPNHGKVAWPAFWLYGGTELDGGTASMGERATEIDIFEFTGYAPNHFTRNVHNYSSVSQWEHAFGPLASHLELEPCLDGPDWTPTCNYHVSGDDLTIHHGYEQDLSFDVSDWHIYALVWTPQMLTWSIDGNQIGPALYHDIPTNYMKVIINTALPDWLSDGINQGIVNGHDTSLPLPATFEIDKVKITALPDEEFVIDWTNGGQDQIDQWYLNPDDDYLVGDFDADPASELLALNPTSGFAHLMDHHPVSRSNGPGTWTYDNATWTTQWSNLGNGQLDWWYINDPDHYLVGDFTPDNSSKDQVLAISAASGFAHLMGYTGSGWHTSWTNLGSGDIHWWLFNQSDRYVVGNFDDDPEDELLAIQENSGHAHLMDFDGAQWSTRWATSSGQILYWIFHAADRYVAADFDGDGRDELLAMNASTQWAQMLRFNGTTGQWEQVWGNSGSGQIHLWYQHTPDVFVAGNFDGDNRAELLAYNPQNGWSQLMRFNAAGAAFEHLWGNGGHGRLHTPSFLLPGDFAQGNQVELLSIRPQHHAYLQSFRLPSQTLSFD